MTKSDIKTKESKPKTVKTLDKTVAWTERIKDSIVYTNEKAKDVAEDNSSITDYGEDKIKYISNRAKDESIYRSKKNKNKVIDNTKKQNKKAKKQKKKAEKNNKKKAKNNTTGANLFPVVVRANASDIKNATKKMDPVEKLSYFAANVGEGKTYDIKHDKEWENPIYYEGEYMEAQDIGNYNFGYMGRALGYDINFLTSGAGIYQLFRGAEKHASWCFTPSLCDDPRDTYFIRLGAIAYDKDAKE